MRAGCADAESEKSAIPREPRVTRRLGQRMRARSADAASASASSDSSRGRAGALLELLFVGRRGVDAGELRKPVP